MKIFKLRFQWTHLDRLLQTAPVTSLKVNGSHCENSLLLHLKRFELKIMYLLLAKTINNRL